MSVVSSLEGCVASLETSRRLLDSSISALDSGVQDLPRLSKVLQTTRHFELLSETELQSAQSTLLSSIRPEVENLLLRVDAHLSKLERREQSLIAKYDLNEGRLGSSTQHAQPATSTSDGLNRPGQTKDDESNTLGPLEEMKLRQMRLKKERLSYAVERLNLQASQRERQLRMSMAAPQQDPLDDL